MATVDVTELGRETLAQAAFPVPRQADFRVAFAEPVHRGINAHANEDTSFEICGVLVGSWAKDADGPYAVIEQFIRCNAATQKFAEVTFTHESWAHINQEMDTKYQDLRIIGWYHSHPNFGIFLSDRDCFIQENFFSGPGQVAFVVDPVRKLEGLFEWRQGKPVPMHHYWVGHRVQVGEVQPAPPLAAMLSAVPEQGHASGLVPDSWTLTLTVLLGLCTALIGFLWGARRTAWEERRLEAGAVAHYGLWKLYKPGFEENLTAVIKFQNQVFREMQKLSQEHVAGAGEKQADVEKEWQLVYQAIDEGIEAQLTLLKEYGLTETERAEIRELLAAKQTELSQKKLAPTPLGLASFVGWTVFLFQGLPQLGGGGGGHADIALEEIEVNPKDLEGVSPEIERAMRSNVLIEVDSGWKGLMGHSIGSGVILRIADRTALIVTNRHVVDNKFAEAGGTGLDDAPVPDTQLRVKMIGEPPIDGKVLWIAPHGIDLALVQVAIDSDQIDLATWVPDPRVVIGSKVFAIGNPHGLGWSHTAGDVSQIRRQNHGPVELKVVQTSAAINPGNSGGGLYDDKGNLIGINTWTQDKRVADGLGFAIGFQTLLDLAPAIFQLPKSQSAASRVLPP